MPPVTMDLAHRLDGDVSPRRAGETKRPRQGVPYPARAPGRSRRREHDAHVEPARHADELVAAHLGEMAEHRVRVVGLHDDLAARRARKP